MEKSIESIWKEGFLNTNELVVPKINDLYSRKSKSTTDKLLQMGKINFIAIAIGALVILIMSYFMETFLTGTILFALLIWLVIYGKKQSDKLKKLDKGLNSYQYIKTVNSWLKYTISGYVRIYRFLYPTFLIVFCLWIWFSKFGESISNKIIDKYPNMDLLYGIPIYGLLGILLIAGLSSLFAGKIYKLDLNLVYGSVFKKLDELMSEMKQLNEENT